MVQVFAGERTLIIEYDSKQDTVAFAGPLFYVSSDQSHTCVTYARFVIGDQADVDAVLSGFTRFLKLNIFIAPFFLSRKTSSIYIRVSRYLSRETKHRLAITTARTNLYFQCCYAQKKMARWCQA